MDNEVRILLGAHLTLTNEGEHTATVTVEAFRVDRCNNYDERETILSPPAEMPSPALRGGTVTLAPGEWIGLIVRQGQTVEEWERNGDKPAVINFHAEASPDGAVQHWQLEVSAQTLDRVYGNDAGYRVLPHVLPQTSFRQLERRYPMVARDWLDRIITWRLGTTGLDGERNTP